VVDIVWIFNLDREKANGTVKFCPNTAEKQEEEMIQR
jgi:hypothetical protein